MLTLRNATKSDVPFMIALEREVMEDHAIALWGKFIPAGAPSLFDLENARVIDVGKAQIGYLMVERATDHLRLRKLYLSAPHQGQGYGRTVLQMVHADAQGLGLALRLSVLRPNLRALGFYRREGMVVVDETPERIFLAYPQACAAQMATYASARLNRPL